ncbi:hypothetical protein CDL15_Pgr005684 [Punica granatum]|uniref:GDSL esterase/lipase At5g14450-like n=1 Tax=Punica granatum TaxID=22663 RepID=A0A218WF95_PUNGR|nr:hypothetical protein CDL15_Pgr005684 [Punica granatum]
MVKVEGGSVGGVLAMLPLLVIVGVLHDVAAVEATPSRCDFPAIYNFGDSNSDTGGISAAFYQMAAPDGETYFHRPAGRASDGRLIIDFIAEHLGLPHLSAYLDSLGTSYQHGANFATGGATIRRQNESWFLNGVSPFSLDIQMAQFDQFKNRSAYLYGSLRNDLAAGFRNLSYAHVERLNETIPDIVNQFAESVQHLYDQGARTFWIHNTGPIGCLAITIQAVHDPMPGYLDKQGCVKDQNDMASEFNRQLKEKVGQLRRQLPEAALTYIDVYSAKYGLIGAAKEQGFGDPTRICCGVQYKDKHVWCGQSADFNGTKLYAGSCKDPSSFVSWDGVHYTEAANHWLADRIVNGSFSDSSSPILRSCLGF